MGEPGGIGAEILLKAWQRLRNEATPFFAIADPDKLRELALCPATILEIELPEQALQVFHTGLPVLTEALDVPAPPGQRSPANAAAVVRSIRRAVSLALEGRIDAVVTNPIDKLALREGAGFRHAGHTEFLGELAGHASAPVMMLATGSLRVIPVTTHIPLREVASRIRKEDIIRIGQIASEALRKDFGIDSPRLAVSGLNPHAGEGGILGNEDVRVIRPAVQALRSKRIEVRGPYPADSMFREDFRESYDVAICMYHDQALIPVKALGFARTVNVTLGLPFIRTSPGHGVAYDLAGTGQASPESLIAALRLASRLAARRSAA